MKEAISKETMSDSSHSCIPEGNECSNSGSNFKSAAMLGLALSVGTSGVLVSQTEASAAVSAPTTSATTEAFSSDAKVSATAAEASASVQVVAFHTVETGESLWQIAQTHRVGLHELKEANALPPETSIRVGQVLRVPASQQAPATENSALIASITADEAIEANAISGTTADLTAESATASDAPVLVAQSVEAAAEPVVAPSAVLAPERSTASIELADASATVSDLGSVDMAAVTVDQEPLATTVAVAPSLEQYRVQAGDTLSTIAASLGTTSDAIVRANALANPNVILAGDVLSVPASSQVGLVRSSAEPIQVASSVPSASGERLTYLRSTAALPDDAGILTEIRESAPDEAASVGGETVTSKDLLGSTPARTESIDPYVANLLEEVREIRAQSVQVSEVETSENTLVESDATANIELNTSATEELVESGRRSSLLARNETVTATPSLSERVALTRPAADSATSRVSASNADSELLAAAPLSPDAYIPAQRSNETRVVSPDMPILPSADEYLPEAPDYFNGYVWPARGTLTSGYGWRWGRMHRGVDVAGPVGTPIVAAASGVVEQAGWNSGGYGNLVEIRHPDGSLTRYAHNNRLNVSAGQSVKQGQQIAEMGSTGYSTGPHLHFEVHQGGGAVNPVAYLPNR